MFENLSYIDGDYRKCTIIHPLRITGMNLLESHGESMDPADFEELLEHLAAEGEQTEIDATGIDSVQIAAAEVIDALDLNALDVGAERFEGLCQCTCRRASPAGSA